MTFHILFGWFKALCGRAVILGAHPKSFLVARLPKTAAVGRLTRSLHGQSNFNFSFDPNSRSLIFRSARSFPR